MGKYITRIQLHKAGENDYRKLDEEMYKSPFFLKKNSCMDADKTKDCEFSSHKNVTLKEVTDTVHRAVRTTGLNYSFTVMQVKEQ